MKKKELLKMKYPKGIRLRLLRELEDPFAKQQVGDILTVSYIDDGLNIHGSWNSGGSLSLIPFIDEFEIVNE